MVKDKLDDYSEIVNYYDSIAKGYGELHFEEQKQKFKVLKENLGLDNSTKRKLLLDVGCGTFFSYDYFRKYVDICGVEPSSKMVELFAQSHPDDKEKIMVGVADDVVRFYGEKRFDFVICVSVAHHFIDPKAVFSAMSSVCKNSAMLGITLLKGVRSFNRLEQDIYSTFIVEKKIDSEKDIIYMCKKKHI